MQLIINIYNMVLKYWPSFLSGIWVTLWISLVTVAGGTIIGALVAMARQKKIPVLDPILAFYVSFFRGTPLLAQLLIFNTVISSAILAQGYRVSALFWCLMAMILNSGAYVSEIFRAGIQAVDKGQTEAAKSLGMSDQNTMIKIIFPQAVKNIIPALGNEFVTMIKETSLVSVYYLGDIMTQITNIKSLTYSIVEPAIFAAIVYYVLTTLTSFGLSKLERKLAASD